MKKGIFNQNSLLSVNRLEFRHYALILLVILLAFFQLAFLLHPFKYDMLHCHFQWRFFIVESLRAGEYPFWNPYQFMGSPLHADPQSGVFYFPLYLFALFGRYTLTSLAIEFILHLFIAGVGFYKLGKRLLLQPEVCLFIAVSYALSGFMVAHTAHLSWIMSASWLPWVFAFFIDLSRKPSYKQSIKLSLATFLFFTGGYPAFNIIAFYIITLAAIGFIAYKGAKRDYRFLRSYSLNLLLSAALALILLSPYLYSVYSVLPYLERSSGVSLQDAIGLPFPSLALISLLLPFSMVSNDFTELTQLIPTDMSLANAYMGLGVLIFILGTTWKRQLLLKLLLLTGMLFFLMASMGNETPLREWLFHHIPFMNLFRFSGLFRLFMMICAILLAGIGLENMLKEPESAAQKLKNAVFLVGGGLLLILFFALTKSDVRLTLAESEGFREWFLKQLFYNRIVLQGMLQLAFLGGFYLIFRYVNGKLALHLLIALISLDLVVAAQLNTPFTSYMQSSGTKQVQEYIHSTAPGFPIPANKPMKTYRHDAGIFKPFDYNINVLHKQPVWNGFYAFGLNTYFERIRQPERDFLELPLYSCLSDEKDSLVAIPRCTRFSPAGFRFAVELTEPTRLVVLQNYYPFWKASSNGQALPIETYENTFLMVRLNAGHNEVLFSYRPMAVILLLYLSLICFLAGLALLLFKTKRNQT